MPRGTPSLATRRGRTCTNFTRHCDVAPLEKPRIEIVKSVAGRNSKVVSPGIVRGLGDPL